MKQLTVKKNNSKCAAFLWALLAWCCVMVIIWLALATFSAGLWAELVAWKRVLMILCSGLLYFVVFALFLEDRVEKVKIIHQEEVRRLLGALAVMLGLSILCLGVKQSGFWLETEYTTLMVLMLMFGEIFLFLLVVELVTKKRPKS